MVVLRLYSQEVDRSAALNQALGVGIGVFQGLSNVVLNGAYFELVCRMYYLFQKLLNYDHNKYAVFIS